ncbi:DUF2164 domain-containing protein [soil metagenome]
MPVVEFNLAVKDELVSKLREYFERELDQELGRFDAEFLLDFITKHFGGHYYNQGLHDALAVVMSRMDEFKEAVYALEQPTDFK